MEISQETSAETPKKSPTCSESPKIKSSNDASNENLKVCNEDMTPPLEVRIFLCIYNLHNE